MNEQLLKTQVLMFYPLGKNSEKPYGGSGIHPPPPTPCTSDCFNQFVVYSMRNPVIYRTAKKVVFS